MLRVTQEGIERPATPAGIGNGGLRRPFDALAGPMRARGTDAGLGRQRETGREHDQETGLEEIARHGGGRDGGRHIFGTAPRRTTGAGGNRRLVGWLILLFSPDTISLSHSAGVRRQDHTQRSPDLNLQTLMTAQRRWSSNRAGLGIAASLLLGAIGATIVYLDEARTLWSWLGHAVVLLAPVLAFVAHQRAREAFARSFARETDVTLPAAMLQLGSAKDARDLAPEVAARIRSFLDRTGEGRSQTPTQILQGAAAVATLVLLTITHIDRYRRNQVVPGVVQLHYSRVAPFVPVVPVCNPSPGPIAAPGPRPGTTPPQPTTTPGAAGPSQPQPTLTLGPDSPRKVIEALDVERQLRDLHARANGAAHAIQDALAEKGEHAAGAATDSLRTQVQDLIEAANEANRKLGEFPSGHELKKQLDSTTAKALAASKSLQDCLDDPSPENLAKALSDLSDLLSSLAELLKGISSFLEDLGDFLNSVFGGGSGPGQGSGSGSPQSPSKGSSGGARCGTQSSDGQADGGQAGSHFSPETSAQVSRYRGGTSGGTATQIPAAVDAALRQRIENEMRQIQWSVTGAPPDATPPVDGGPMTPGGGAVPIGGNGGGDANRRRPDNDGTDMTGSGKVPGSAGIGGYLPPAGGGK
jgi:hypothetical protein